MLREALLSSVEVDNSSGEDGKQQQGWIKLIWLAMSYVWPDTFCLKLRTIASIVLVLFVRCLNILVPPSPLPLDLYPIIIRWTHRGHQSHHPLPPVPHVPERDAKTPPVFPCAFSCPPPNPLV